ncbi:hypothetical protein NECAME_06753 [Necator americanus]|uniref:Uncharacterized protein n=1 Tax=Necator americanus TaxID=51031 RepID=W2TSD3_NECAM|nr:hypothetical protein NECAME_06753 [Necator americanus]ETN84723.1 hypothetical protein NECAME_06753 [Necator americanus]
MRFLLFLLFCLALVSSERKYGSRGDKFGSGRNKNTNPCKEKFGVTGPCLVSSQNGDLLTAPANHSITEDVVEPVINLIVKKNARELA